MRSSAAAWRLRAVPKFMELNDCWVWKKKLFGSILFSRLLASLCGKIVLQPRKSTKFTKKESRKTRVQRQEPHLQPATIPFPFFVSF